MWGRRSFFVVCHFRRQTTKNDGLPHLGKLKAVIDRVYPMTEIAEAHRHLENKEQFGKVVVTP